MSQVSANGHKSGGNFIRRANLPDKLEDAKPETLRILCEEKGWNIADIAEQFDARRDIVARTLRQHDIEPSSKKSPWLEADDCDQHHPAGRLWRTDPEDIDWTTFVDDTDDEHENGVETRSLADFTGGGSDE